jgi:FAD/FMN-containing dehydrogenase
MPEGRFSTLSENIRGNVITPAAADYELARKVYNGMIDRHPDAIVRCADVADVRAAVNFARQERLTVAIRGGGHNGAGLGVCDHGLVIDLSLMKGVRVDPAANTVRAETGCTQADLNHAAHSFGLAVPVPPGSGVVISSRWNSWGSTRTSRCELCNFLRCLLANR